MSSRHVIAVAAALLCTSAFAQSEPSTAATASSAALPAASASVAAAASASVATASSAATPASSASVAAAASTANVAAVELTITALANAQPGDADAGQTKSATCAACHGMDGNSSSSMYPRLAGQSERYIAQQLLHFKTGERANPIMAGFVSNLTLQDMRDIGAFYATQKPQYGVADEALAEAGESLYLGGNAERGIPACMACHGPAGSGNAGAPYPHLAGQHADYIQQVLTAWKNGTTWGDSDHANIMPSIAKRLTEQDILALSSYIEGLHPASADND